jgi:hypothetical protein
MRTGTTLREGVKRLVRSAGYRLVRVRPRRSDLDGRSTARVQSIPIPEDLYYRFGEWRYVVPLDRVVGRPCFGYGSEAWHPLVAAVREFIATPDTTYEESILRRFYDRFQPATIAEAQFPSGEPPCTYLSRLPAHTLFEPWLLREPPYDDPTDPACRPPGSPLFGPVSPDVGERVYRRLIAAYESIRRYGYRPELFPGGWIGVVVLRHQGEGRYLVIHGQHRVAVLSALGRETLEVRIQPGMPPVIDSAEAGQWPHVALGRLSPECAAATLARYFKDDGTGCARRLGLLQVAEWRSAAFRADARDGDG